MGVVLSVLLPIVFIQPVKAATPGLIVAGLNPDTINVKQFGAKGDNIKNDSAAFQNAIKYASENKSVLLVPKGIYKISSLLMYPDCFMLGQDSSSVLILTKGSRDNRQCMELKAISQNIHLKNICFDANGQSNSGKNIFCVKTTLGKDEKINNLVIQNCRFTGSKDYGALFLIGLAGNITNVVIFDCKFYNTGSSAVSIRGINGLTFVDNTISNWDMLDKSHPAFSFQSEVCSNILFNKNHFKNKDAGYFAVECAGTYLTNGKFTDNIFDGNGYNASGISGMFDNCLFKNNKHINGGGSHRSGYELVGDNDTITNNFIDKGAISLGAGTPGLAFAKGAIYIVTENKVTSSCGLNNVCLSIGGVDTVKSAFIEHNIFDNGGGKGNAPVVEIGQRGPATNVIIQNNEFHGAPGNPCIRMKVVVGSPFSDNITIRKNTFFGVGGFEIFAAPIWKRVYISGNDFSRISGDVFVQEKELSHEFHLDKNKMPGRP